MVATMAVAGYGVAAPPAHSAAAEFQAHLRSPSRDAWFETDAADWMRTLSTVEASQVAEVALADAAPGIRIFGAQLLFDDVSEQRGASAAAGLVIRGDDLTPLGWSWLHSGDAAMTGRRLALIRGELESRKSRLTPQQRQRVDKLLCADESGCR